MLSCGERKCWSCTVRRELCQSLRPLGYLFIYAWRENTVSNSVLHLLSIQTDITYLTACLNSGDKFINCSNCSCLLHALAHLPTWKALLLLRSWNICHFFFTFPVMSGCSCMTVLGRTTMQSFTVSKKCESLAICQVNAFIIAVWLC